MLYVDSVSMVSIRIEFITMAIDVGIARVDRILETYVLYRNPPPAQSVGRTAEFTGGSIMWRQWHGWRGATKTLSSDIISPLTARFYLCSLSTIVWSVTVVEGSHPL